LHTNTRLKIEGGNESCATMPAQNRYLKIRTSSYSPLYTKHGVGSLSIM